MLLLIVWLASVNVVGLIQEAQTDFQDLGKLLLGGDCRIRFCDRLYFCQA